MKKWENPVVSELGIDKTFYTGVEYVDWCDWDGAVTLGLGNEEYTDPNTPPPADTHPNWVWCTKHNRWHPMNHGKPSVS